MKSVIHRPIPIRDQAYQTVKEAILRGELATGTKISERELCEQLKISRTPVREALQRLELEGYILFSPRRGAIVQDTPTAHPEELFTLLGVLEGLAARWAAQRHTPEQLDNLRTILEQGTSHDSGLSSSQIHQALINAILEMSRSDRLNRMLAPLHEYRRHMMDIGHRQSGRPSEALAEHWKIFQAIAAHDGLRAEQLVRDHLARSLVAYLQTIDGPFLSEGD